MSISVSILAQTGLGQPTDKPPPFPGCGNGVCEGSIGENETSCPVDCAPYCGNGRIDLGEECDSDDLAGKTCRDLGFERGLLLCDPVNCTLDASSCTSVTANNTKLMSRYSVNEAFLISNDDWRDVLPLVPVTTWTNAYGVVVKYPTLIFHEEESLEPVPVTPQAAPDQTAYHERSYSMNGKSLVRFYLSGKSKEEFLRSGVDIAAIGDGHVDVVLTLKDREHFSELGYDLETLPLISDRLFEREGGYGGGYHYHSYDETVQELMNLELEYPGIAKAHEIGMSVQNRSIMAMKVSDNVLVDEDETEILVVGNHHAREIMTVEVPIFMLNALLKNYDTDPEIKKVVDSHELWFVPMVNPDGHVIVEKGERGEEGGDIYWRKNARDNNGDDKIDWNDGVDLNRNYGYTWGYDDYGSSPQPTASGYRGTAAFSEPETQAIRDLVMGHDFSYVLDYHSAGGYILYPWGHISNTTPDDDLFRSMASEFNQFLSYPDYRVGQISHVIYTSNGDSIDWHYGEQTEKGKIMAFGFEVTPEGSFRPSPNQILPTGQRHLLVLLNLTGYPISYTNRTIDADSVIHFLQQYSPGMVTLVGETPPELDNLLVAAPSLGAGLDAQTQTQRISPGVYLSYWDRYDEIVFVDDDYELALLASTYASLINAPLVIEGTGIDVLNDFSGLNIICVGSASPSSAPCAERYDLEQLQQKYLQETKTTRVILVNPTDLGRFAIRPFSPEKTAGHITKLYGETSLAAPILAAAKHELIISSNSTSYQGFDAKVASFFAENYQEDITECTYTGECSAGFGNVIVYMKGTRGTITFFLHGKSNVYISTIDSKTVQINKPVTFEVAVRNNGFETAEDCNLTFGIFNDSMAIPSPPGGGGSQPPEPTPPPSASFSSQSSDLILIDTIDIGNISADEDFMVNVSWTPSRPGSNRLYFEVMTSSPETDPFDNDRIISVDVYAPSPDIRIWLGEHPEKMLIGAVNRFDVHIENTGSVNATDVNVSLFETVWVCGIDGCDRTTALLQNVIVDTLGVDEERMIEFAFTPNESRYYDFMLTAEAENDTNTQNNKRSFSLKAVTQEPDISMWYDAPANFLLGQSHTIEINVMNEGYEPAQNSRLDFYVQEPDGQELVLFDSVPVGEIAGEKRVLELYFTPSKTGYHTFRFNLTYEHSGGSGYEETWMYRKVKLEGVDLEVYIYAEDVELGEESTAEITIINTGTEAADNVSMFFYDNGELIDQRKFNEIAIGSVSRFIDWVPSGLGRHDLMVTVNHSQDIDLSNNQNWRYIYVYTLKNVTFHITDNPGNYTDRYLGIAYGWNYPETVDLLSGPATFRIPDMPTSMWIIDTAGGINNDEEYAVSRFIDSDLHSKMFVVTQRYRDPREEDGKRLYDIYANEVFWNYDYSSVAFNYPDYSVLGVDDLGSLSIYYCENWDFDYELCLSGWREPYWMSKIVNGNRLYMYTDINSAEAFAIGNNLTGTFGTEIRSDDMLDMSVVREEYDKRQRFYASTGYQDMHSSYGGYASHIYSLTLAGFFYNCSGESVVNVTFNGGNVSDRRAVECHDNLPAMQDSLSLGMYTYRGAKNITLDFDSDLIFYDSDEMLMVQKEYDYFTFGENDSTGIEAMPVNVFSCDDESEFYFGNEGYSSFVVYGEKRVGSTDLEVYLNGELVGELDLSNSNGEKGREFRIPAHMLGLENFTVGLRAKSGGQAYLAKAKMRTDFDPYYLTIFASPEAVPIRDNVYSEADFRQYGDMDGDTEAEFAVGRIMGISLADVSSYLARDLFYYDLDRKTGGSFIITGDYLDQGIPTTTCGTGFCECYYDVQCDELFSRYAQHFDPYIHCDDDFVNGTPRTSPGCTTALKEEIKQSIFHNSSLSMFGDHGAPYGWAGVLYTDDLQDLAPQFTYSFACSTCEYGYESESLFCTNVIRRGSLGYIGAVTGMYGHHFFDEFLDETLINGRSVGYAFKVGKNKEARFDWGTPNAPGYEYIRDSYGVHDILVGDPTFDGRLGK